MRPGVWGGGHGVAGGGREMLRGWWVAQGESRGLGEGPHRGETLDIIQVLKFSKQVFVVPAVVRYTQLRLPSWPSFSTLTPSTPKLSLSSETETRPLISFLFPPPPPEPQPPPRLVTRTTLGTPSVHAGPYGVGL